MTVVENVISSMIFRNVTFFTATLFFFLCGCKHQESVSLNETKGMSYENFNFFTFEGNVSKGTDLKYPKVEVEDVDKSLSVVELKLSEEESLIWNCTGGAEDRLCTRRNVDFDDNTIHIHYLIPSQEYSLELDLMLEDRVKYLAKLQVHFEKSIFRYYFSRFDKIRVSDIHRSLASYPIAKAKSLEEITFESENGILFVKGALVDLKKNKPLYSDHTCYKANGVHSFWWHQEEFNMSIVENCH